MDLSDVKASDIIAILNIMATVAIAVVVTVAARRSAILQTERDIRAAWISIDQAVLSDDSLLETIDRLLHPDDATVSMETRRVRWSCYLIRNPLENMHLSAERGLVRDKQRTDHSVEESLRALVRNDTFYYLVTHYTNDIRFVELCRRLRHEAGLEP